MRHVAQPLELPVPAVVHLKSEHYSAVVERKDGAYVLRDLALGGTMTLTEAALADEMSGFVLVPEASGSVGRGVTEGEGQAVVGHCIPGVPGENRAAAVAARACPWPHCIRSRRP